MSLALSVLALITAQSPSPSRADVAVDLTKVACVAELLGRDVAADSSLLALYESGTTWERFLDAARARRDMWLRHANEGVVPPDALARARVLPGRWRILAIAVDACSDSVNTIPFLARLVAAVPQLEMRVISPEAGRALMEARRTPDGRAATPTLIVLNAAGDEVGCWIERPSALQAIALAARTDGTMDSFVSRKAAWYATDAGASTIHEVVTLLEKAAAGARGCDAPRTGASR